MSQADVSGTLLTLTGDECGVRIFAWRWFTVSEETLA